MRLCLLRSSFAHSIPGSIFTDLFLIKVYNVCCLLSLTWAVSCLQSPMLFLKSCPCFCFLLLSSSVSSATSAICLEDPPPSSFLLIVLCGCALGHLSLFSVPCGCDYLEINISSTSASMLKTSLCCCAADLPSVWARNTHLSFQNSLVDMEMSADIFLSHNLKFFSPFLNHHQ